MILREADEPQYIVIDVRNNPNIPLVETVNAVLAGPWKHPKFAEWLVIGDNWNVRLVERMLCRIDSEQQVQWFTDDGEVLAYLDLVLNSGI